ncbi:metal-dependent transcriptional regulator [Mucilaginibacter arboris]|uniref:Transcriptional regulator MntR n=1 Tax=Mucilaginibacter arboris TaxID=2682090 RepID=A0A7K1T1G9_9SPHI|nr:metal-dependent transcriptional regulator [Mucilaginibacter arboris]MVN23351.1 metal-dependent transcriptional regulator [Mucilaginibacter arboris]
MQASFTEENYLKAIYHLSEEGRQQVNTNRIAMVLNTKPASVTDMLKKLSEKNLLNYTRYQGVSLTDPGRNIALKVIRKHRLWEFFLVEKLNFGWDEVHDLAEQLEHIQSVELINRLDSFLGFPEYDPHGDPIPKDNGTIKCYDLKPISALHVGETGTIAGVREHSPLFLQYLEKMNLVIGKKISMEEVIAYDETVVITTENNQKINISKAAAKNILITI